MKFLAPFALLPMFMLSTQVTMAQSDAAQCTTISADSDRLACFDAAFAAPAAAEGDAQVVIASEQLIPARPSGRAPATITVSCAEDVLSVAFGFAGNTLSALGNDTGITWQLDLLARTNRTLPVDDSNTAILLDKTPDSVAFLRSLEGANSLTVRVTPANSRTFSVRYRLATFAQDVQPVLTACGL